MLILFCIRFHLPIQNYFTAWKRRTSFTNVLKQSSAPKKTKGSLHTEKGDDMWPGDVPDFGQLHFEFDYSDIIHNNDQSVLL